jgi:hypothetical protein
MLDPGGLESSRSEKTALYGDISRLDSKAAGESGGSFNSSEDQRRDLAEWKRLWDAEEHPVPDIPSPYDEYPTTSISRPAAALANVAGYPMDAIMEIVNWFLPPELQSHRPAFGSEWLKTRLMPPVEAIDYHLLR